jgi:hypothetical protein
MKMHYLAIIALMMLFGCSDTEGLKHSLHDRIDPLEMRVDQLELGERNDQLLQEAVIEIFIRRRPIPQEKCETYDGLWLLQCEHLESGLCMCEFTPDSIDVENAQRAQRDRLEARAKPAPEEAPK